MIFIFWKITAINHRCRYPFKFIYTYIHDEVSRERKLWRGLEGCIVADLPSLFPFHSPWIRVELNKRNLSNHYKHERDSDVSQSIRALFSLFTLPPFSRIAIKDGYNNTCRDGTQMCSNRTGNRFCRRFPSL